LTGYKIKPKRTLESSSKRHEAERYKKERRKIYAPSTLTRPSSGLAGEDISESPAVVEPGVPE